MARMSQRYPQEIRERAVRLVGEVCDQYDSEWAAIASVAAKLGIGTPETLRKWLRKAWRSLDDVEVETLEWVDWRNHRRLHSACCDLTPAEYEQVH